jgi:hypothetical protein
MKKLFIALAVVVGIGVCAMGSVGDMLALLVDDDCISAAELQPILDVFGTAPVTLALSGSCATIGDMSTFLYGALGLQGTFLERLFGMTLAEMVAVAQRENLIPAGAPGDTLTGFDLAAMFTGLADFLLTHVELPSWVVLDLDALAQIQLDAQAVLPPGVLVQLIPALVYIDPLPTS